MNVRGAQAVLVLYAGGETLQVKDNWSPHIISAGGSESSFPLWVPPPFLSPACLSETPVEEGDTETTPAYPQGPPTAALWTPFSEGAGTEGVP